MISISNMLARSLVIAGTVATLLASGLVEDACATADDNNAIAQASRPGQRGPGAQNAPAEPPAPMMRQDTEAGASQLLDDTLADDPERIARAKAKADEAPPQTTDQAVLAEFYRQRAFAAQVAGRQSQAVEDWSQALVENVAVDTGGR